MQRAIDTTGALCGQFVKAHAGIALRELVVFGSRARDSATPRSDVDILVVIEPADRTSWRPAQNVAERVRIHAAAQADCPVPLDLWVRTIDQFEEARGVVGCVEYLAATRGCSVYSRMPSRPPLVQRSAEEIRRRNVRDLLDDSRRVLGRAVRLELGLESPSRTGASAAYYAWRAIQHAVCAVFAWRQRETPEKVDNLSIILGKLASADPRALEGIAALRSADVPTPTVARQVLGGVVWYLGQDTALRAIVSGYARWLNRPLYQLADAPMLKA